MELCKGWGTCVKRCPIDAVKVEDKLASINLARCIGCGLCVPTCTENAISLVKKSKETVPPATEEDYYDSIMAYKQSLGGKMRNYVLKTFLRIVSRLSKLKRRAPGITPE
jgi:ferredoxin